MTATVGILNALGQCYGSASSKAFLAAVCDGEGGTAWNILFGGTLWTGSLAAFPPWPGVQLARGSETHAAGAFQFEPATYAAIAKVSGRTGFQPQDQIQNAWDLADQVFRAKSSALTLHGALEASDLLLIPAYLIQIWPGGCDAGFPKRFANKSAASIGHGAPRRRHVGSNLIGVVRCSAWAASVKLEAWQSTEDKRRWKIVRTDDYTDVDGEIITADELSGECCLQVGSETKTLSFGPRGIRIVGRRR